MKITIAMKTPIAVFLCIGTFLTSPAADTKIPFRVDHEAPLDITETVVVENTNHIQFRVEFNGIDGDRVPAFLYIPKNEKKKHPAVLLQYGSGGSKKTDYIVQIGKQFVDNGFVVLTIDSAFRGERRSPDKKDPFVLQQMDYRRFEHYCADYSRAVDFLEQNDAVDENRIAYVGISWGAITGITFVANDPRIKAMGSLVGGGGFPVFFTARESHDPEVARPSLDPADHVANIAPRPLVMINVTLDLLVAPMFAKALHEAAARNSHVIWYETDHYFSGQNIPKIVQEDVIDFLLENMPERRRYRSRLRQRTIRSFTKNQTCFMPSY